MKAVMSMSAAWQKQLTSGFATKIEHVIWNGN
jgi:hypothetical protein